MNRSFINARLTEYTPEQRYGGLFRTTLVALSEIKRSRYLIWTLFVRDFRAQMRQKVLSYLWAFINPLLAVFGFIVLNVSGVLHPGNTGVAYPVYVFVGTSIWNFLPLTVVSMSNTLLSQGDLILKTNVPKIALAVSSLAQIAYNVLVHLIVLALVLAVFQIKPHPASLLYVVALLPILVLGASIGLAVSVMSTIARDLVTMVQTILQLLMYLTPVVYVARSLDNSLIQKLIWWNPLSYLVDVPRSLLLEGTTHLGKGFGLSTLFTVAMLMICARVFYILQDLIAERL